MTIKRAGITSPFFLPKAKYVFDSGTHVAISYDIAT
jgi:hypothetical protein